MVVLSMLTATVVAFIAPSAKIGGIVASRPSAAVVAPVMIAGIKQPFVYDGTSSVNAWAPYDYRGTYRPYYPMAYNSYGGYGMGYGNYGYGGYGYSPYSYGRYGGGYGGYGYSPYSYGRYGGGYGGYGYSPYSYGRYGGGYGRYSNYSPYSYGRYGMGYGGYGMGGYGGYGMGYNNYSPYSYGGYGGYMSPRFDTASRMGLARQYSY